MTQEKVVDYNRKTTTQKEKPHWRDLGEERKPKISNAMTDTQRELAGMKIIEVEENNVCANNMTGPEH